MIDQPRNKARAEHIRAACTKILESIKDLDRNEFLTNSEKVDATIYQLIVIGEAVKHIDFDILEKYDYPWYKVKAFRNYAAHEYFNIEIWTVWDIVSFHVEELREIIDEILENEF